VLFTYYYQDGQIKEEEMGGLIACKGEMRKAYKILNGIPE
jgi:hypothetical protein